MKQLHGPCRLSPASPAGLAELLLRGRIDQARGSSRSHDHDRHFHDPDHGLAGRVSDRGASVVEWVIISALVVGIAVAVGAIMLTKLRDKATSIDLNTGGGGGGTGGGGGGAP
jgi:hypothetical protein